MAADRIGGLGADVRDRVAEGAGHRGGLGIRDEGQGDARAGDLERRDHGGLHAGFAEATTRSAACACHAGRTSISMRAMAQGKGQLEIQLGHLCNNRCVFCVSGQLTSRGEAPFLPVEELYRALDEGWAAGQRRVTLLGGEPTIQPYFMEVVRRAVAIGFEVVIFSNGSKPGRTALVDEVAATGGKIEWRFSFQGGTREAHERTTRRRGSFAQLLRSVDRVRAHGHRVTVNMCVVRQNQESVDAFPELLLPRGVAQLHLDMVNPYDTGTLDADGITGILPRYSDLVPPLERMIGRLP